jgi:hypothetical protein
LGVLEGFCSFPSALFELSNKRLSGALKHPDVPMHSP